MSSEGLSAQALSIVLQRRNRVLSEVFSGLPFFTRRIFLLSLSEPGYLSGSIVEQHLCRILSSAVRALSERDPSGSWADQAEQPAEEIAAEAVAWVVRRGASDFSERDRLALEAWRGRGEVHGEVLRAVSEAWGALDRFIRDSGSPSVERLSGEINNLNS